jgi:predicted DCC family thiol-disulfide oxidoreductase YuxK
MAMDDSPHSPAPYLSQGEILVLFDGTCKLCNGWASFIIHYDHQHLIRLATVQSCEGQHLLRWAGLPTDQFNTIVLIVDDRFYVRSDAMFEIARRLPSPARWLGVARLIPAGLRDWVYDKIALNRYRLFGRYDTSRMPPADHPHRFLSQNRCFKKTFARRRA